MQILLDFLKNLYYSKNAVKNNTMDEWLISDEEGNVFMKVKKVIKGILIAIVCILLVVLLLIVVMFIRQAIIDYKINDDYTSVVNDISYQTPVSVEGVNFIEQKISCGYACIEILSSWQGNDITEQTLFEDNGGMISTSMGTGFLDEISKQFPK